VNGCDGNNRPDICHSVPAPDPDVEKSWQRQSGHCTDQSGQTFARGVRRNPWYLQDGSRVFAGSDE